MQRHHLGKVKRVSSSLSVAAYILRMARPKQLVLSKRQQGVVDHFAGFIKDEAARNRYVALVESTLRAMSDGFSDLHVTAACLRASTDCYPERRKCHVVAIDRRS